MKNNMEKLKLEINSIESTITERLQKIKSSTEKLDSTILNLLEKSDTINLKYGSLTTEVEGLKKNESGLTQEDSTIAETCKEAVEKYALGETEISDLKHKKKGLDADIANAELKQSELKNSVSENKTTMEGVKKALINAEDEYNSKVKTIEDELNEYKVKSTNTENQYKILKILLEEGYVKSNYYQIMKSIEQPGIDTAEKLARAAAVGRNEVEDALSALADRGVLSYDKGTGAFEKKMELNV